MAGEANGTAPACRGLIREVEPRVDVFGRVLFRTQDLDPIYVALLKTARDDQLHRWLVAYWLFYNAGAASWLSEREGKDFWDALMVAAKNETPTPFNSRWPRGAERRHFRGAAAVSAGDALQRRYARPEDMVAFLLDGPMDIRSVIARARRHHQVGSWLAFKITDMIDAVLGAEVKQDDLTTFLYDTPRQSIIENWQVGRLPFTTNDEATALTKAMFWLAEELNDCVIPHKPGQRPDWFSLETVWCKHLSHVHGHYPVGKDIREIQHGLEPWLESSPTAKRFLGAMPTARKVDMCAAALRAAASGNKKAGADPLPIYRFWDRTHGEHGDPDYRTNNMPKARKTAARDDAGLRENVAGTDKEEKD